MKKRLWCGALGVGLVLVTGLGAGCGKKTDATGSAESQPTATAAAPKPAPGTLSASQEVLAAIDKKDYDGAIAALLRIRQSVSTAEQQVQFANLADEVRIKLLDAAPDQPKAAEALAVLRKITGGR